MPPVLFLITPVVALLASSLVIAVIRYLDVLEREPWWAIGLSFLVGLLTVPVSIVLSLPVSIVVLPILLYLSIIVCEYAPQARKI